MYATTISTDIKIFHLHDLKNHVTRRACAPASSSVADHKFNWFLGFKGADSWVQSWHFFDAWIGI